MATNETHWLIPRASSNIKKVLEAAGYHFKERTEGIEEIISDDEHNLGEMRNDSSVRIIYRIQDLGQIRAAVVMRDLLDLNRVMYEEQPAGIEIAGGIRASYRERQELADRLERRNTNSRGY